MRGFKVSQVSEFQSKYLETFETLQPSKPDLTNPSRSAVRECKAPWPRPIPAKFLILLGYYI